MTVSRRLRFEVLRRDGHTCRYCGASAPEAKLTVDHVIPVALGGSDDPGNLVAACASCNGGKTSIAPDSSIVADVSADAMRWADALKLAAAEREAEFASKKAHYDQFRKLWENGDPSGFKLQLPGGWENSLASLTAAGLTYSDFEELAGVAMSASQVRGAEAKWKYFCGCCWKRVKQAQDRARELAPNSYGSVAGSDAELPNAHSADLARERRNYIDDQWAEAAQKWLELTGARLDPCMCSPESWCGDLACRIEIATIVIYSDNQAGLLDLLSFGGWENRKAALEHWHARHTVTCECGTVVAKQDAVAGLCLRCAPSEVDYAAVIDAIATDRSALYNLAACLLASIRRRDRDRLVVNKNVHQSWMQAVAAGKWSGPEMLAAVDDYYSRPQLPPMVISPGCVERRVIRSRRASKESPNAA